MQFQVKDELVFFNMKKNCPKTKQKKGLKSIIEIHWIFFPEKTFFPLKICAKKRHYYKPLASWSWSSFAICITKGFLLLRKFETLCGCNPLGLIHISSMALIKFGKDLNGLHFTRIIHHVCAHKVFLLSTWGPFNPHLWLWQHYKFHDTCYDHDDHLGILINILVYNEWLVPSFI